MNKLVLQVVADSNGLIKGLNQAQSHLDKFMKASDAAGASLGGGVNRALEAFKGLAGGGANAAGVLAGAFVAATTAAFGMTVQAGKIAEQTEQLAQKTGIAAESLEGMSVALARNGLESGSIAVAMKGLSKEIVGVSAGTASSIKLFQSLGISLQTVEKGTGATLRAIADAFQEMPDGARKAQMAVDLFGRSGLDLIPILNKGAAGLDEAMRKSAEFGLILSDTARGDLTVFDDAMDDLSSALKGFAMQVGAAFAPSLTALVNGFTHAIVFTKNVFNQFADAASTLTIRLSAMVASVQIIGQQLMSLKAFSAAAWQETLNHVKAIDAWAASEIQGVHAAREAAKELDQLAIKHLDSAKAVEVHAQSQERLGQQIVAATKIQLSQAEQLGKHQERRGADIVSGTQIGLKQEAERAKEAMQAYEKLEAAFVSGADEQITALGRNEEAQGRYIVSQSQAAQQVKGFWETQLDAVVASNAFSVSQIVTTWTSGIANSIVNGGNFIKQAWQATQVAIIQGALNTTIQYAATVAKRMLIDQAGAASSQAIWLGATKAMMGALMAAGVAMKAFFLQTIVPAVIAVGKFIVGVLTAIAGAMKATIFGIPVGVLVLAGAVALVAALAATGNLGFEQGGIGDFGSGTPATLHGQEAIIPLNKRGAQFMRDSLGMGDKSNGQIIHTHVHLDGRQIALAVSEKQPGSFRTMGF